MEKLALWRQSEEEAAVGGPGVATATAPGDFRLGGNSTSVMSDYHICRYDALLGVLVCVGDDAKVLVLGRDTTRELLPIRRGTHWLDCYVYSGTTTFLVLGPEVLLCMDYSVQRDDSFLAYSGKPGTQFTCLHVPQGLTCGAVGRKDGRVGFFRLHAVSNNPQDRPRIVWTTVEVDVLGMCQPFCKGLTVAVDNGAASADRFFSLGSVLAIDSYPENPNAFIGVVAGVPGVCKWYLDENRVSCFFDARSIMDQPDGMLATCKVTPGGVYVAAATMHSSKVLLWNESKKRRDKSCELYWVVDLTAGITGDHRLSTAAAASIEDPFWYNEYRVGIHMARTALEDSSRSTNDKHSQMYLLVQGQRDILEVVIRLDDREVVRQEQIVAHLNAYTAKAGVEAAKATKVKGAGTSAEDYFKVFHVEPCVLSNYWTSGLTDVDLEALFITSAGGLRPILAKRNRQTGGIESIKELRELSAKTAWYPRAMLMRLPEPQIRELALEVQRTPATSTWERLLRGGDTLLSHACSANAATAAAAAPTSPAASSSAVDQLWRRTVMVTVADAGQAICLSPQSNEAFSVNPRAVQNCSPWTMTVALGQDPATLVLEAALPSLESSFVPSELVLRVTTTESVLSVMKTDIRRSTCKLVLDLDRAALQLEGAGTRGTPMVRSAVLVDARLEPSRVTSRMGTLKDGKSLLLLLEDSSAALVDLSGAKNDNGQPNLLILPAGLLPVGARTVSLDAFWAPNPTSVAGAEDILCLACLFADGKGFLLWNLSGMRMIAYAHPPFAATATKLCVAAASPVPQPNLSGEVRAFTVRLRQAAGVSLAEGEYGEVLCQDPLGAAVFSVAVGFGLAPGGGGWCVRPAAGGQGGTGDWVALGGAAALPGGLSIRFRMSGSVVDWAVFAADDDGSGAPLAKGMQTLPTTICNVRATWGQGAAELRYDTPEGEMRAYVLNAPPAGAAARAEMPCLAFIAPSEMNLVDLGPYLRAAAGSTTGVGVTSSTVVVQPAVCRLDPARTWEHMSMYRGRGAVLVITRDANGWRWVNILDNRTARPRMQTYATLDFAGEEHVQVLSMEMDNILHLYLLGETSGTIGHLFIEANLGACVESSIVTRRCFTGRQYQPTPSTFRGYGRFLPPAPTLKQETGFLKRLMTLPWADVALKLERETLRDVRAGQAAAAEPLLPQQVTPAPVQPQPQQPPQQQQQAADAKAAKERQELFGSRPAAVPPPAQRQAAPSQGSAASPAAAAAPVPGGRYAQLKAVAESQNVSLTEARRMMSENMRKLQERGERLNEVQNKSAELAQQANTFEALCRQLKEKQRSSWLS